MSLNIKTGTIVKVEFEDREIEAIVIDPDGLGRGQPSIGLGFRMAEKYMGLKHNTLSDWTTVESGFVGGRTNETKSLKAPSGNAFRVVEIHGLDGNTYKVIEAADWVRLTMDVLKHPGRTGKATKNKLIDFLGWFAVKGFYADAYTVIKGQYTAKDTRAVSQWFQSRVAGMKQRKRYTDFLQAQGCHDRDYAKWTNYVYIGLFGMPKAKMIETWELIEGDGDIGRNYIPEAIGLDAVAYCEQLVVDLHYHDLQQAHDDSINFTKKRFFNGVMADFVA